MIQQSEMYKKASRFVSLIEMQFLFFPMTVDIIGVHISNVSTYSLLISYNYDKLYTKVCFTFDCCE